MMQSIPYNLVRSKRKTVAIHICNGFVEVRASLRMPQKDIDKFVSSKEKWINKHLEKSKQQECNRKSFSIDYGDTIYILNNPCDLFLICPVPEEVLFI